jgi:Na+-transporting NADH:ubiquinone oxidoreductase subunit A
MANVINIKKGLDINLQGKAVPEVVSAGLSDVWSLTPTDYHGFVARVLVKSGDRILAGTPLLADKNHPEIQFVSAVSGTVLEIKRGAKRKLLNVLVQVDAQPEFVSFPKENPSDLSAETIQARLLEAGMWPFIKQRPYDVIANPAVQPKAIFINGFNTAPLAPDYAFALKGQAAELQAAVDALSKLTAGSVFLSLPGEHAANELKSLKGVEFRYFNGVHPAGNVGVQINHIQPVNKGEVVWTIDALNLLPMGRLFLKGKVDLTRLVAVAGPEVIKPQYVRCVPGTALSALVGGNVHKEIPLRYVNGDALSGQRVDADGFLGAYAHQLTVLHEGTDVHEFVGWIMPRFSIFSASRTYYTWLTQKLFPKQTFAPDTRILGGERALIMSGEYDKVFPMDILPEQLLRACLTLDYEKMEQLGIYEVAPEDYALCEYVCTSKIEVQRHVREALDALKRENGD